MVTWTWETWPDLLIDFGRDLYVAWRIAEGEILYRDLGYFNGPLSPYLNAAWLSLLGEGIRQLVVLNLLVGISTAVMLYALLVEIADRPGAGARVADSLRDVGLDVRHDGVAGTRIEVLGRDADVIADAVRDAVVAAEARVGKIVRRRRRLEDLFEGGER